MRLPEKVPLMASPSDVPVKRPVTPPFASILPFSVALVPSPSLPARVRSPLAVTLPEQVINVPAVHRLILPSVSTGKVTATPLPETL